MKMKLKLTAIFPQFGEAFQEALTGTLKELGLSTDGLEVKRMGISDEDMKLEDGTRSCIHRVNTRDVDRDGEIVVPSGIDLRAFKQNPIVLWGHNYKEPQIGSDEWIKTDDSGYALVAKTNYASTPRAQEIWTLRKEGHLRTSSIGFVPVEIMRESDAGWGKMIDKATSEWPEFKKQRDACRSIIKRSILLEHSDVPIPCNPNALTLAVAKGMNLASDTMELFGLKDEPELTPQEKWAQIEEMVKADPSKENIGKLIELLSGKGYVITTQKQRTDPAPVIRILQHPPLINVVNEPTIRICHEDTVKEIVKNLVDLNRGRV